MVVSKVNKQNNKRCYEGENMCNHKNRRMMRWAGWTYLLALIGLATLLLGVQKVAAQNCSVTIADGPGVPDEKFVHIGDTVHFFIHLNADDSVCKLDGGTNWCIT